MNLKAGYIVDGISNILKNAFPKESIFIEDTCNQDILNLRGLLETISSFNVNTKGNFEIDYNKIPKLLAVQNNILTRGLPTRAPLFLEQLFVEIGLSVQDKKKSFEYKFDLNGAVSKRTAPFTCNKSFFILSNIMNISMFTYS